MAEHTHISWCDSTWNCWYGCTKVSPACDACYAEALMDTRYGKVEWGAGKPRVRTSESYWRKPLKWNAVQFVQCGACEWRGEWPEIEKNDGHCPLCKHEDFITTRRRVFCASLADWLDNEVPIEWFVDLLDVIRKTANLDWLLLTKRIGNWKSRLQAAESWLLATGPMHTTKIDVGRSMLHAWIGDWLRGAPPRNVWLGATVVNQQEIDRDVGKLLDIPAWVRFLSMEPLLGLPDLSAHLARNIEDGPDHSFSDRTGIRGRLHWIITGGESGANARQTRVEWLRSVLEQCAIAGVAFHHKQNGEWLPEDDAYIRELQCTEKPSVDGMYRVGKKIAGRELDGHEWSEFPVIEQVHA